MTTPKVTAVVLNYFGEEVIGACLASLRASAFPLHEIIVADNGSTDGSIEIIERDFPEVVLVKNGRNLGAPAGRNRGLERALAGDPDYVYTLDNDLRMDPNAIGALVELLQSDDRIGCAGSIIYTEGTENLIFNAGNFVNWTQNLVRSRGMNESDRGQFEDLADVDYVGSGAMLVPARLWRQLGLFDEGYIGYGYEDSDFGLRVNAAGLRVVCFRGSRVWHRAFSGIGRYSFKKKYLESRNAIRFLRIHGTPWAWLKFSFYAVAGLCYAAVREGARGNLPGVVGKARGLFDGLLGRERLAWRLLKDRR
jgi:GT2 family glycosyltransferase